jgi:hypothetical protein
MCRVKKEKGNKNEIEHQHAPATTISRHRRANALSGAEIQTRWIEAGMS